MEKKKINYRKMVYQFLIIFSTLGGTYGGLDIIFRAYSIDSFILIIVSFVGIAVGIACTNSERIDDLEDQYKQK